MTKAWCDYCGEEFKKHDDESRHCSKVCARRHEWAQRHPSDLDAEIDRVLLGFGEELKRVLRKR